MRRTRPLVLAMGCTALLALAVVACTSPLGSQLSGTSGSLSIAVGNNINALTLAPTISMDPTSYTVTGTGPHGGYFSATTTGTTVTKSGLAFGTWTIVVNAVNSTGDLIGTGTGTAQVNTGRTTSTSVPVTPVAGTGSLALAVSWPVDSIQTPSIVASLTPALGSAQDLSFDFPSDTSASYANPTVGNGYYTLTFTLNDNGLVVAGAAEVVRIVAGQATSGTYAFANVNKPGGSLQVNIAADLQNPLDLAITGASPSLNLGSTVDLSASVTNYGSNVIYVWYVNGVSQGIGSTFTFGSGLSNGSYRIDVTGYSADGTRAGSTTQTVQIITST